MEKLVGLLGLRVVAVLVASGSLSLLAPPANLGWLQWVAYLPMFWALDPNDRRLNVRLSWLYGLFGVGLIFRWIVATMTTFAPIPIPVAVAILGLFAAVFGAPYMLVWPAVHPMRRKLGWAWVFVFPALEVVVEYASMWVLLFPYQHGITQYRTPYVWQLASVTGVWGVSYLVFLVNSALAEGLFRWREGAPYPRQLAGAVAGILAVVLAFGAWRYHSLSADIAAAPTLRVAQLQSDKGMEYRMSHTSREAWDEWIGMTQAIPAGAADLVVWPEGACPYDLDGAKNARDQLIAEAKRGSWEMVIGAGTRRRDVDPVSGEKTVSVFNSVFFFEKDGDIQGYYNKLVPLPFGEYVPLRGLLPRAWVKEWASMLNIGDFQAGDVPVVFEGASARIATPICYEAILPRVCRKFEDPSLLVNVTNDAWFGRDVNPFQHAMMAAARSMELGVPMVRTAYTGVSMVVHPNGDLSHETEPFAMVNRVVEVHVAKFRTLYAALGDWFPAACALLLAGLFREELRQWATRAAARLRRRA